MVFRVLGIILDLIWYVQYIVYLQYDVMCM